MSERFRGAYTTWSRRDKREFASRGGAAAHQQGKAHVFTSSEARKASRKRTNFEPILSRVTRAGRYEYYVIRDGIGKWVSRQRVHQLREKGLL